MGEVPILRDLVVIFLVAVVVATLLRRIGVPTIAGFILAGTIAGPSGFGLVHNGHEVELLAEIGVALLLFGIGLELQLARLRRLWRPVLVGGAVQMITTAGAASALAWLFGLSINSAVFLGLIVAVSSTAIVLRGLETRGEIDAPHGRLTMGILVFQDLSVVLIILTIPLLAGTDGSSQSTVGLLLMLGKALLVIVGVLVGSRFLVPRILHLIAQTKQRELFVLTLFLICIGTAWVVAKAGASLALGAFMAGIVVADSVFRRQAMAELIPFREMFTSLFFISVGMLLDLGLMIINAGNVLLILLAILTGKFLFVFISARVLRLPARVCVLAGAALAQVGEFSFVLMHAARGTNLLPEKLTEPLLPAIILSMLITPLALAAGPKLAAGATRMRALTKLLGIQSALDAEEVTEEWSDHIIIAGYGITGRELAKALKHYGICYVIVDLNPDNVREASEAGELAFYGDITSAEVFHGLGAERAREIIISINDAQAITDAISVLRRIAPKAYLTVRARYAVDAEVLCKAGASEVVPDEVEAAVAVVERLLLRHGVPNEKTVEVTSAIRNRHHEFADISLNQENTT